MDDTAFNRLLDSYLASNPDTLNEIVVQSRADRILELDAKIRQMDANWKQYCDELMHKYGEDEGSEVAEMLAREEKQYASMAADLAKRRKNLYDGIDDSVDIPLDPVTFAPILETPVPIHHRSGNAFGKRHPNSKDTPVMLPAEARLLAARFVDFDPQIKQAINKAAASARETLQKRLIIDGESVNTAANRVGYFVTGLRREMAQFLTETRPASKDYEWVELCKFLLKMQDTRQWADIAVPTENGNIWSFEITLDGKIWGMSLSRMKEIVMEARQVYTDPLLQTTDQVKSDLAELERGMVVMFESINRAKRINEEADKVVGSLSDLVATLPQEN